MHVRKFYGDTLEETLSSIKQELGPDAIILKTVNNKGIKGAFKKKKIEITAAISEKNYIKKANVDRSLPEPEKKKFYSSEASHISKMINAHAEHSSEKQVTVGYGKMALNKTVKTLKSSGARPATTGRSGLDDFLGGDEAEEVKEESIEPTTLQREEIFTAPQEVVKTDTINDQEVKDAISKLQTNYELKIDELESRIFELSQQMEKLRQVDATGIRQMRNLFKSVNIDDHFIQNAILKLTAELSDVDLENSDLVFERALQDMADQINTELPLFSQVDIDEHRVITLLLSEASCGQTSTMLKLGSLLENSVLISFSRDKKKHIAESLYSMPISYANSVAEIVSLCRKAVEQGKSVLIDYQSTGGEENEIKKLIDGLRRSFDKVEVLITLSSLHSEIYNTKVVNTFRKFADGIILTFLDLCMNFGALFNIAMKSEGLPFKFFSTGDVIPDDLEGATKERILAGIFQLD